MVVISAFRSSVSKSFLSARSPLLPRWFLSSPLLLEPPALGYGVCGSAGGAGRAGRGFKWDGGRVGGWGGFIGGLVVGK